MMMELGMRLASTTSLSPQSLALPLVVAVAIGVAVLAVRAWRSPFLARIGLRNVGRRRLRSGLIVLGLMLATMFVSTALTLNDTMVRAVQNVAVFSLGRVDEEVAGGSGPLGMFSGETATVARNALAPDQHVADVEAAIELPNVLVEDETTRQVRGDVLAVGIDPTAKGTLADVRDAASGSSRPITSLSSSSLYLNSETATLLHARVGDSLLLFSSAWPGQRYAFVVGAIVSGGPLAVQPSLLIALPTLQQMLSSPNQINRVYVANAGDGISGVGYSKSIAAELRKELPTGLHITTVKADGVAYALSAQDIFGRILTLYALFALSIGLLLIFLIFALLAAERRTELGMVRAVGMHRGEVVWMLLFEGAAYDVVATGPGLLLGLGLGILTIAAVSPTIAQFGLPLQLVIEPSSIVEALCLGLLFTLVTVALAVGTVSRFTVAAALRGLPEPPPPAPTFWSLVRQAVGAFRRSAPMREVSAAWLLVAWALVVRGPLPLVIGIALLRGASATQSAFAISLSISFVLAGLGLLARSVVLAFARALVAHQTPGDALGRLARITSRVDRVTSLLVGVGLALYWSLPFDTLQRLGLPRYGGGIEVIFAAGVMMVFGAVLAVAPNLDLLVAPFQWLSRRVGRPRHVAYIAMVYPSQQRYRTSIGLAMFSLVCFTMVVMACIAASTTQRYGNFGAQSGGYDVVGQPLFSSAGGVDQVAQTLQTGAPGVARDVQAIAAAQTIPLIMIQPSAQQARWGVYPAATISGAFLHGTGLPLVARAAGYATDAEVWQAMRDQPGLAVIDAGALSAEDLATLGLDPPAPVSIEHFVAPPIASGLLGFSALESLAGRTAQLDASNRVPSDVRDILTDPKKLAEYALKLEGIATGPGTIGPTSLWVADPRGNAPQQVQIIGIVDNSTDQNYGLLASPQTFAPLEAGLEQYGGEFYLFKLTPGANVRSDAAIIGSALLSVGFETTVIQDALLNANGPAVFASRLLTGLVGLTLLVGMAALAVSGTRAVVERRQQIGMLRALGYRRRDVRRMFVLEALFVAGLGAALGLLLGIVLCRNVFAVSFFEKAQSGIALVIPWGGLAGILAAALGAALLSALIPAQQASQVTPADALRYE